MWTFVALDADTKLIPAYCVGKCDLPTASSKRVENLKAAVALHFAHYSFVRIHSSLRVTPAMAAGVSNHLWTMEELAALTDTNHTPKPRGPYSKRNAN